MTIDQDNAVRLAVLENEMSHMKATFARLEDSNARAEAKLDAVLSTMSEARGSWKTLLTFGGAAGTIGGAITWALAHLKS